MKILLSLIFIISTFCNQGFCGQLWNQSDANPILEKSVSGYSVTAVGEPFVINFGGTDWVMFYSGVDLTDRSSPDAIGRATSTDGTHWTKASPDNPVIGNGFGNEAGEAAHSNFHYEGGILYCFYSNTNSAGDLIRQQSIDHGVHWTDKTIVISYPSQAPSGVIGFTTSSIQKVGSTYHMALECLVSGGGSYAIYYWTSTDLTNWTVQNGGNALTTLQLAVNGAYGGPNLHYINSAWYLWYHCNTTSGNGNLVSCLARSADFNTWSILDSDFIPFNLMIHTQGVVGVTNGVGDLRALEVNGISYLYYNRGAVNLTAEIAVNTFQGSLTDLINQRNTKSIFKNVSIINGGLN